VSFDIPPERERQFALIEVASTRTLEWAKSQGLALVHIYPVVPFVETNFSLDAWLFVDEEQRLRTYQADGSAQCLADRFRLELEVANYPKEWCALVTCSYATKEVVDRDFEGNYYYFLR
jgi:hypothetical protein